MQCPVIQHAWQNWKCSIIAGSADPLVMENGRNLIDMICKGFESPDIVKDEEEQYNYSEAASFRKSCDVSCCMQSPQNIATAYSESCGTQVASG